MKQVTPHQKAALNYRDHISLTANAGSGKTFVLSQRYVDIALNEDIDLHQIIAITFTEKAAGELYSKISAEINRRFSLAWDELSKRTLERIRRQLVSANISTIHAFCTDILRQFPLEAQLDANFMAIDNELSEELIQISIEEIIRKGLADTAKKDDLKYLIRTFGSRKLLEDNIANMIRSRKNVFRLKESIYSDSTDQIAALFYNKSEITISNIISGRLESILENIANINNYVINSLSGPTVAFEIKDVLQNIRVEKDLPGKLDLLKQLSSLILTKAGKLKKTGYLKNDHDTFQEEINLIEKYFHDICCFSIPENHTEIETELARFGKIIISLFDESCNLYSAKKRENRYLDFEDILILTRDILQQENVLQALREKYKYIMIDEYQDTNEIQYEIFMPLLDFLKKGNLFIVGDEKQSIYMFRDAELEVFNRTKEVIQNVSGKDKLLNLPDSFRMSPHICLFTNYIFSRVFSNPEPLFNEVGYSTLVCAREDNFNGQIEFLLAEKNGKITEGDLVAGKILNLIKENYGEINFGDIAILCRKRKSFDKLEDSFRKYNLPYKILGGKGFYQRQTIYDIYNYLSFLQNQNDNAALVGILRSPFFTISDSEIFEISLEKKVNFWESLISYSLKSNRINEIVSMIRENINAAHNIDLTSLIRKILQESGYLAVIASGNNGEQELANINKLIEISSNYSTLGFKTPYDFISYLEEAISRLEDEGQPAITSEDNSIKILTIHQAKGLEFRVVFLFNCNDFTSQDTAKSKTVVINKELGILTAVPLNENYFSKYFNAPIVDVNNFITRKKNQAELKRLLYVAITRAKDYLFISAEHSDYKFAKNSFIEILSEINGIDLSKDQILIEDELEKLVKSEQGYSNNNELTAIVIPVIKGIEEPEKIELLKEDLKDYIFFTNKIIDVPQEEIISATKIAVFKQCPLKYQLTYELGFTKLFSEFRNQKFNTFDKEEEESIGYLADVKGRIIHSILQKNSVDFEKDLRDLIKSEISWEEISSGQTNQFYEQITGDIKKYFSSDTYREINSFPYANNEIEIYARENDFFLYGIIDKLILSDNKAIIIDYKTDDIGLDEIKSRAENYLPQLKFYSYLIRKQKPLINEFEMRIIFIKQPEDSVKYITNAQVLDEYRSEIIRIVQKIRMKEFDVNAEHCPDCFYTANNKCIKNG